MWNDLPVGIYIIESNWNYCTNKPDDKKNAWFEASKSVFGNTRFRTKCLHFLQFISNEVGS